MDDDKKFIEYILLPYIQSVTPGFFGGIFSNKTKQIYINIQTALTLLLTLQHLNNLNLSFDIDNNNYIKILGHKFLVERQYDTVTDPQQQQPAAPPAAPPVAGGAKRKVKAKSKTKKPTPAKPKAKKEKSTKI